MKPNDPIDIDRSAPPELPLLSSRSQAISSAVSASA